MASSHTARAPFADVGGARVNRQPLAGKATVASTVKSAAASAIKPTSAAPRAPSITRLESTPVREFNALSPQSPRVDQLHVGQPLHAVDYISEIFEHFHRVESQRPTLDYLLPSQTALQENPTTDKMRYVIVDWLIEVASKFRLLPETLYLAVEIFDRYLQIQHVPKRQLQLAGVTCLLIASKYEEMSAPPIADFSYISAEACKNDQILDTELQILNALKFELTIPTIYPFVRRGVTVGTASGDVFAVSHRGTYEHCVAFVAESSLLSFIICRQPPSVVACAVLFLARRYTRPTDSVNVIWPSHVQHYMTHSLNTFKPIVVELNSFIARLPGRSVKSCYRKYEVAKYASIATQACVEAARFHERSNDMFA